MPEEQDVLNQQPGPDDGTAQDAADDIAPDDAPVETEPEAEVAEPEVADDAEAPEEPDAQVAEGEPKGGQPAESPEDIVKSRAYFQQKAQEETALRKQLQAEMDAINGTLDQTTTYDWDTPGEEPVAPPPTPAPKPVTPQPASEIDIDDLDLYDPADRKVFMALTRKAATEDARQAYAEEQAADKQKRVNAQWKRESDTALAQWKGYCEKHNIPEDVVKKVAEKATAFIPNYLELGAPSRRIKYALDQIAQYQVEAGRKKWLDDMTVKDAAKVTKANLTAQPAAAAPSAPSEGSGKSANDIAADEIAPDDDDIPG